MTECFRYHHFQEHCYHENICCECGEVRPPSVASSIPTSRLLDEFGFPVPEKEKPCAVSKEDVELCKRFLSKLKDQTLSRSIHKVLTDLIGRLP